MLTDDMKLHYYRCLQNWETEPSNLRNTCGLAQDRFQQMLNYFKIPGKESNRHCTRMKADTVPVGY